MSEKDLWNELGNIQFLSGYIEEAIDSYSKALEQDQDFFPAYINLAKAYEKIEKYDESISTLIKGLKFVMVRKERASIWKLLGEMYRRVKDFDNAHLADRMAKEDTPENERT